MKPESGSPEENPVPEEQGSPRQDSTPDSGLNINDIYAAASIIDTAVRRGAFSAGEAASVGAVYNKLTAFISAVAPHLTKEAQSQENEK